MEALQKIFNKPKRGGGSSWRKNKMKCEDYIMQWFEEHKDEWYDRKYLGRQFVPGLDEDKEFRDVYGSYGGYTNALSNQGYLLKRKEHKVIEFKFVKPLDDDWEPRKKHPRVKKNKQSYSDSN